MLKVIWKEKNTLKKLMAASIEEELLHLLLTVAIKYTCKIDNVNNIPNDSNNKDHSADDNNTNIGRKILYQLGLLDRFQTVLKLTLFGNQNLKKSLLETIEIITINNKVKKESASSAKLEDFFETPNISQKSSEVILKIKEMLL